MCRATLAFEDVFPLGFPCLYVSVDMQTKDGFPLVPSVGFQINKCGGIIASLRYITPAAVDEFTFHSIRTKDMHVQALMYKSVNECRPVVCALASRGADVCGSEIQVSQSFFVT